MEDRLEKLIECLEEIQDIKLKKDVLRRYSVELIKESRILSEAANNVNQTIFRTDIN